MANLNNSNYIITLWRDEEATREDGTTYLQEKRICTIGSNTMTSPLKARNPQFTTSSNGELQLTFDIPYKYYDYKTNQFLDNPFNSLLINERKLKLYYQDKWYHLILKNCTENSTTYLNSWTASSALVNELAKNGFTIEFDTELENNMGTINELGATILEGTDWSINKDGSILVEKQIDQLYRATTKSKITITNILTNEKKVILSGAEIYLYYNQLVSEATFLEVILSEESTIENNVFYPINFYYIDNVVYEQPADYKIKQPNFILGMELANMQGQYIVRKELTKYDTLLEQYINLYKDSNNKIYHEFVENEYLDSTIIVNYAVDALDAVNTSGWRAINNATVNIEYHKEAGNNYYTTTNLDYSGNLNYNIFNLGIQSNASLINEFVEGEKYVLRYKLDTNSADLNGIVSFYEVATNDLIDDPLISFTSTPQTDAEGYKYIIGTVTRSCTYSDLIDYKIKPGLFLKPTSNSVIKLKEFQFFVYVEDTDGNMIVPGAQAPAMILKTYKYYAPSDNAGVTSIDDIIWAYKGQEPSTTLTKLYNNDPTAGGLSSAPFEKVRSITGSESNRYNLIMTLAETFECWVDLSVETEPNGAIIPNTKKVTFKEYIGKDNYAGFKYGINLNSIQRTLNSDNIVTKIIVKNNSNEFATDGYCSISRAESNYIRENFAYNFQYFINKGLIDGGALQRDLYTLYDETGNNGYFYNLRKINFENETQILLLSELSKSEIRIEANVKYLSTNIEETQNEITQLKANIKYICGIEYDDLTQYPNFSFDEEVQSIQQQINVLTKNLDNITKLYKAREQELNDIRTKIDEINTFLKEQKTKKDELNSIFYQKYGYYIQEGTWISEDYIDDELYYLDSMSTLYTSAFPQVTYSIGVSEISSIPKYKNYQFQCGDKTFIEDTEFFGWIIKNGRRTPYREEVVVTAITYNLDDPAQNTITIQNYKKQFEELFQRMAAATQSLQYASGGYNRVSGILNPDNTIDGSTFQNTMENNSFVISNAKNQSVIIDDNGITVIDLLNPTSLVRIVNGAIAVSRDGGAHYQSAITGYGVNTELLTAGSIDADKIRIMNGSYPSFRWDKYGINAYSWTENDLGQILSYDGSKFTRMDRYGFYGIPNWLDENNSTFAPSSIQDIYDNASFALTWDGFFLKSDHGLANDNGYIEISSKDDIQVIGADGSTSVVKIGLLQYKLDTNEFLYGLQLWDNNGNPTLMTRNDGSLWLENSLKVGTWNTELNEGNSSVSLGLLEQTRPDTQYHEVFNASNNFIVYEDGYFTATEANITGIINATGGTIGGITIEEFEKNAYSIEIESSNGTYFKNSNVDTILSCHVYKGDTDITSTVQSFQWYCDGNIVTGATSQELRVNSMNDNIDIYKCVVVV